MATLREYWNRIFWGLFIIIGIGFVVLAFLGSMIFLDLLFGFVVIAMGIHKLGEEYNNERLRTEQDVANYNINNMSRWMNESHKFLSDFQKEQEAKVAGVGEIKAKMEEKMEDNYRDVVKKVIQLENKLNDLTRAYIEEKRRR